MTVSGLLVLAGCGSSTHTATGAGPPTRADGLRFAACMRSHGVTGFPDPNAGHFMQFDLPAGVSPQSPAFRAAERTCQHLIPAPSGGGGGPSASQKAAALAFARCMRTHGVPNYPDPTYHGGRPIVEPLPGLDMQSPAFLSAAKACGSG